MADVVIVRYLFTFLLLNACYAGLPGLDSEQDGVTQAENHLLEDTVAIDKKMMVQQPRYRCHECEPPECGSAGGRVCGAALYCYKATVRAADGALRHSRGCSSRRDHYQFTCRTHHTQGPSKRHLSAPLNISCCRGELCNAGEFPQLAGAEAGAEGGALPLALGAAALAALAAAALAALAVLLRRRTHRLRVSRAAQKLGVDSDYFSANMYGSHVTSAYYEGAEGSQACALQAVPAGDSTLREYLEGSATSGSGSGLPLMVQRTLAKQVSLVERIGKGRCGEVWRGLWCSDAVAVRIASSREEARWARETEVYGTVLLRHDNLLAYVGSDMTSGNSCTQLWLITHYHPLGSLHEYLGRTTLTRHQMMLICLSVVKGLLHLHTDIHGTQGKPAIAHRDIRSKNILVKLNGECCIGDLGLAVTREHPPDARRGPPRYLSPEMLDMSMNPCLESYKRCDIYALSLVFWEVTRRATGREHHPPYYEYAPHDPGTDDMRKIVCVDNARPGIVNDPHPTMQGMVNLMRECWHQNPSVRLPALRIKKTLLKLASNDNAIRLNEDSEVYV